MHKVKLQCKVITPLFLAGADGKTPELRPPSFKGMMRFWWRAIRAEENLDSLRAEEEKIFGGAGSGEGEGRRSPFSLKIYGKPEEGNYRPLPHSRGKTFSFPAITSGDVTIELVAKDNHVLQQAVNILNISLFLGGVGKRVRRGFGCLFCSGWDFKSKDDALGKVLSWLNSIKIKNDFHLENGKIKRNSNNGGSYPWIKEITIGRDFSNKDLLLRAVGEASHNCNDPSLGNANPRMGSPVYVSTLIIEKKYYPVITKLHESYPNNYRHINQNKQRAFIERLLQGKQASKE